MTLWAVVWWHRLAAHYNEQMLELNPTVLAEGDGATR